MHLVGNWTFQIMYSFDLYPHDIRKIEEKLYAQQFWELVAK